MACGVFLIRSKSNLRRALGVALGASAAAALILGLGTSVAQDRSISYGKSPEIVELNSFESGAFARLGADGETYFYLAPNESGNAEMASMELSNGDIKEEADRTRGELRIYSCELTIPGSWLIRETVKDCEDRKELFIPEGTLTDTIPAEG